jgi:hypothetical protein
VIIGSPLVYVGFCDVVNLPDGRLTKKFISSISEARTNLTLPGNGCSSPKWGAVISVKSTLPFICGFSVKSNIVPPVYISFVIVNVTPVNFVGSIYVAVCKSVDVKSIFFHASLIGEPVVAPVCTKAKN